MVAFGPQPTSPPDVGEAPPRDAAAWARFVIALLMADAACQDCLERAIERSQFYGHACRAFRTGAPLTDVRALVLRALEETLL